MPIDYARRRFLLSSGLVLTTAVAGCMDDDDVPADADATVTVGPGGDPTFEPEHLQIQTGETVHWTWDSPIHNVHVTAQPDDADWEGHPEIVDDPNSVSHTFTVPGTYEYQCDPHVGEGMLATLVVEE